MIHIFYCLQCWLFNWSRRNTDQAMDYPGNSGGSEAGSPQTSLQDASKLVLNALSNIIRKTPELRRNFVSGNKSAALEAMDEVRNIFQPKKAPKKAPKKPRSDTSIEGGKRSKKKRKYFKHVIGCFAGPDATLNPSREDWDKLYSMGLGKLWKGCAEACVPGCLTAK